MVLEVVISGLHWQLNQQINSVPLTSPIDAVVFSVVYSLHRKSKFLSLNFFQDNFVYGS